VAERLRTPRDYAHITRALLARLVAEKVQYAEITISAGVVLWQGQDFAPVYSAVRQAAAEFPSRCIGFWTRSGTSASRMLCKWRNWRPHG
jgi:adenosine deaminase